MYFYIQGALKHIFEDTVVVDASGVGYYFMIPSRIKSQLPAVGDSIKLFTYFHVREDQQSLFGFLTLEDKELFIKLISVSGVGPKVALKMVSELEPMVLCKAILNNDLVQLTQVSGVGKKMAERLIIELKDKLSGFSMISDGEEVATPLTQISMSFKNDLTLALKTLGYSTEEIKKAMAKMLSSLSDDMSLETAIKTSLKYL